MSTKILTAESDIGDEMYDAILGTVAWFVDEPRMPTDEFIDRLCKDYGDGWDIESYDNPAVRKIMRIARSAWREARA